MNWQVKLEKKIKEYLKGYTACHDFYHLDRVRGNAMKIAKKVECDKEVLEAAALLHDSGYKNHEDDDKNHYKYSMKIAKKWLPEVGFPKEKINGVLEAIRLHDNYCWEENGEKSNSTEVKIIQDSDRIDALGAIGIVRMAYYFGERGYPIYNDKPMPDTKAVWINHSLLNQTERESMKKWENMNFEISKKISKDKNEFLKLFHKQLKKELLEHHGGDDA